MRTMMTLTVACATLLAACADRDAPGPGDAAQDAPWGWPDWGGGLEPWTWPEASWPLPDAGVRDWGVPQDGGDGGTTVPCKDNYEPNEYCSDAKSVGTAAEGTTWVSKTATVDPGNDADWYTAVGEEGTHFCVPFLSQTYNFKVRLAVPSGRVLKLCVYQDNCLASGVCKDNASVTAPTTLEVSYSVSGTCGSTDDTTAKVLVHAVSGAGACPPYTLSFNYDD